ncbi:MAG: hypothetical protein ACR2MO_11550 [Acidimicrobiales bacterium]
MAARVLAVLVAVAMVTGALFVRGDLDDDDDAGSSSSLRIVCATELAAVCEALDEDGGNRVDTQVEAAATTADRLTGLAPGLQPPLDGWLVTAPWPAIVAEARDRAGREPFLVAGDVLARSPAVLAVRADRNEVLGAACGGEAGWKCLGEVAGKAWTELPGGKAEWGKVKPGHPPVPTVAGLTVLGSATVGYFGGTTNLSLTELEDSGFQTWLRRLEQARPEGGASPFLTLLQRPSAFDAVGVLEAEAGPALLTARAPKPVLLYPEPVATADVVLATTDGRPGDRLAELVSGTTARRALADAGWRVEGEKPAAGIKTSVLLPPAGNLPAPGVLDALRREVVEAGR